MSSHISSLHRAGMAPSPQAGLNTWFKVAVGTLLAGLWFSFRSGDLGSDLSFAITGLVIAFVMYGHASEREPDLFHSVTCTFFFVFLWLAPLLQVHAGAFPNTIPVVRSDVVAANAVVLLFIGAYALCRFGLGRVGVYRRGGHAAPPVDTESSDGARWWPGLTVTAIVIGVVLIAGLLFRNYLIDVAIDRQVELGVASHAELLIKKFLFTLPLFLALYAIMDPRLRRMGQLRWFVILMALGLLLVFKNPFNEKRNAIGPMYLIVTLAMFPGFLRSNLRVLGAFLLVIAVVFPLSSALTHTQGGLFESGSLIEQGLERFDLREGLQSIEFDAWSELVAAMHYVADRGLAGGEQALAAVFFFVPRAWYPGKPEGSGKVVADYLMETNHMWFDNLSSPLPAEGFLDFGWLGVVMYAGILALVGAQCRLWQRRTDLRWVLGVYTSLHLMYLLRGDLASSFAYLVAILIAVVAFPLCLQIVLSRLAPGQLAFVRSAR